MTRGSARIKVEDEIVEAGPDGVEYLAFGAGDDPSEVEMAQGWWSD